jgi:putative two-component system response regulator
MLRGRMDERLMGSENADIRAMRVVVVDDHPPNVALLAELLGYWGFTNVVGICDSGAVAAHCAREPPDLLLLDLYMPEPDGFAVLDQLQDQIRAAVSLPVLVLTGSDMEGAKHRALAAGARDVLTKPYDSEEVRARVANHLELRQLRVAQHENELDLERRVRERTAELEAAREEMVKRLALAGEFRDDDTGEHTQRVGETSRQLAVLLAPEEDLAQQILMAAPLHDIGKIAVPDAILLKRGHLADHEAALMQTHTVTGAQLLAGSSSRLLQLAQTIALTHHERWDGAGYPHQLMGERIPLAGRIVATADVFDALTHKRPYKNAWSVENAVREIASQSGRHFDPRVVDAFLSLDHAALI